MDSCTSRINTVHVYRNVFEKKSTELLEFLKAAKLQHDALNGMNANVAKAEKICRIAYG